MKDQNQCQLEVVTDIGNASYSIGRMEQDLKILHSKWQIVEEEMAERSRRVSLLQADLEAAQKNAQDLAATLADVTAEKDAIANDRAAARAELDRLQSNCSDSASVIQENEEQLRVSIERIAELESKKVELQLHLQDLQTHINGRNRDWESLNAKVQDYEDTIEGISASLNSHDKVVAELEEQKAGLALKVMELERELAQSKGRHLELDASRAELRQELKNCASDSSRIEKLRAELRAADERIADMANRQRERDSGADAMATTIGELRERLQLSEPAIAKQELRIVDLECSLRSSEETVAALRGQLASATSKLEQLDQQVTEYEIRVAEMQMMKVEVEAEKKKVEAELDAQRELVQVLEDELGDRHDDPRSSARSAVRLKALDGETRARDVRIDDRWRELPKEMDAISDALNGESQEVMLAPEELFADPEDVVEHFIVADDDGTGEQTRYPLTKKELIIGRSHNSDIRINNKFISRIHARIKVHGSTVTIEDAGSTNGFLVNSIAATRQRLKHGDELEIGTRKFHFL